ncbi:tRNA (uracil) methyltransferase [Aspergillus foveolatus]|uniref:tRNA (uracil) methyltransferase n=1 Tax=Aspergillus foveolatus TaxID=210207 RepID=UPI003CCE0E73
MARAFALSRSVQVCIPSSSIIASTSITSTVSATPSNIDLYHSEHIGDTALYLLLNPGLTSSVLFRADILAQSGKCPTLAALEAQKQEETEKEASTATAMTMAQNVIGEEKEVKEPVLEIPAREVQGFELHKTLIRRLIPRNQQLDVPVDQTCNLYSHAGAVEQIEKEKELGIPHSRAPKERFMVIYTPHISSKEELPYYHPLVRSMAFVYECDYTAEFGGPENSSPNIAENPRGTMSIHFLPYENDADSISTRLERSLTKLIEVQIRTTRGRLDPCRPSISSPYALIKDNVIPRNRVQDTYSRLKNKYAADLNERWIESTEPSKHVFEDLSIAAFLIELWRNLYGAVPGDEREQQKQQSLISEEGSGQFPGFVDIACGNGVLVYILISEGYSGWGFDARRRKTWSIFPTYVQERLKEEIYIPKPFMDVLAAQDQGPIQNKNQDAPMQLPLPEPQSGQSNGSNSGTSTSTSLSNLPKDTFIISNHADELTLWTPILSTLLNPANPPPFLAIPCCSHSLSGARHRFRPQSARPSSPSTQNHQKQQGENEPHSQNEEGSSEDMNERKGEEKEKNPETGDLKQMRKDKLAAQNPHNKAFSQSAKDTNANSEYAEYWGYWGDIFVQIIWASFSKEYEWTWRVYQGYKRGGIGESRRDRGEGVCP